MDGQNQNEQQNEFLSPDAAHQIFIEDQTMCCLCGSKLKFHHKIDYLKLQVTEDADCPSCNIRLKTKDYGLN